MRKLPRPLARSLLGMQVASALSVALTASAQPAQSASPSLGVSLVADFAAAAFSGENAQTGSHDPRRNGFDLQALEMAVGADVDPYFRLDAGIALSPEGVEIEEAYATTTALPLSLQARAGAFLTRFGRINATHLHAWDFVDQPLVLGKIFGGEGNRGLGVELSWLTPLPWYAEIVLSETSMRGHDVDAPRAFQTTVAWKQFHALSPNWSLALGASAAIQPEGGIRGAGSYVFGADLFLKYRPITRQSHTTVSIQAEAMVRKRGTPVGAVADAGLYAQVVWRFAQRWATGARYDFVNGAADDALDPTSNSARHRATANLTFHPTEFARIRVQGSADTPFRQKPPVCAAFLALEVAVGAHGAHPF